MDELTLKMILHTIEWHRPRAIMDDALLMCKCNDDMEYDEFQFVEHLQEAMKNDLKLYGVLKEN